MWIHAISVLILLADRLTKVLAQEFLSAGQTIPVVPHIFHLTLVENPGIAFGLFGQGKFFLTALIVLCLVVLMVLSLRMRKSPFLQRLSLAFILGGASGNLIDRLAYGHVIDFLDFRVWPVFNVADSFITVGVFLFFLMTVRSK